MHERILDSLGTTPTRERPERRLVAAASWDDMLETARELKEGGSLDEDTKFDSEKACNSILNLEKGGLTYLNDIPESNELRETAAELYITEKLTEAKDIEAVLALVEDMKIADYRLKSGSYDWKPDDLEAVIVAEYNGYPAADAQMIPEECGFRAAVARLRIENSKNPEQLIATIESWNELTIAVETSGNTESPGSEIILSTEEIIEQITAVKEGGLIYLNDIPERNGLREKAAELYITEKLAAVQKIEGVYALIDEMKEASYQLENSSGQKFDNDMLRVYTEIVYAEQPSASFKNLPQSYSWRDTVIRLLHQKPQTV